ncbi:nuclear transition protein 2 [Moschus berezovskii]|uniref:nuclear transition protein 2 n=1 Tax=Moschus berezovskii TaxID=68408 RepID=UPI0024452507|nr:nuclear transition protein 2 [Moschus berezovskii]
MDTKTHSLPNTHTQTHSNSRPQSHSCNQCSCSHHCQSRSRSRSQSCRGRSSSQSPRSHRSPAGHQCQSPGPSPLLRRHRYTMHSHQCPSRPITHSCSHSKNRKNMEGKVIKRKQVKRSKQVYKRKRQSSVSPAVWQEKSQAKAAGDLARPHPVSKELGSQSRYPSRAAKGFLRSLWSTRRFLGTPSQDQGQRQAGKDAEEEAI